MATGLRDQDVMIAQSCDVGGIESQSKASLSFSSLNRHARRLVLLCLLHIFMPVASRCRFQRQRHMVCCGVRARVSRGARLHAE